MVIELDEPTLEQLRLRATTHGRTIEEEAGEILKGELSVPAPPPGNLYAEIRRIVEPLGGFELPEIPRGPGREPPTFD